MTPRKKKLLWTVGASLVGLIIVLAVASILILQSSWFANFVREKIIATTEESTGGTVELGSFQFDWRHLTVRIRDFVLHGTEPKGADPLVRVPLLTVKLKLFAGLKKAVDLQYLGIQGPRVDFIVFPDGKTNVPEPKIQKKPSQTSGLQTVVDLAVGRFEIQNGLLEFSDKKASFGARGENLRLLLNYNALTPAYAGNLSIDPLLLASGNLTPLDVHVNFPVTIEKDAIKIADAKLNTSQSQITLNGSLENMNAPKISAQVNANVSLSEMRRSFDLPIDAGASGVPHVLSAELSVSMDEKQNVTNIRTAHLALGHTTFQASGTLDPSRNSLVQFSVNLALGELAPLMKVTGVQTKGSLLANGTANVDAHDNYNVNGTMNSNGLSIRTETARLNDVSLYSPFHADPYLISLDGLKLKALGGDLTAKVFVEKLQRLSAEGALHNFSLPVLARAMAGKELGYDGSINGALKATGDLKAKGTTGYLAQVKLDIVPGRRGIPISGRLYANYAGASDTLDLGKSYLDFPNSRLDLSGSLNRRIDLSLVSHNLNDFLPAANFGASKPESTLPVELKGGTARIQAQIAGSLSTPRISSHIAMNRFAIEERPFDEFAADLAASPSGASIRNGLLRRNTMQTTLDASLGLRHWSPTYSSPLAADIVLRNGDVADLLSLAGESSIPATGRVGAEVHIQGSYGNPLGSASLQVLDGSAYNQPIDRLLANVNLSDQLVTLSNLELDAAGGRVNIKGAFQHPRSSFTVGHAQFDVSTTNVQLANIKPLQQQKAGIAGLIQLKASAAADIRGTNEQPELILSNVSADLSARSLRVQNQAAGDLTATASTANGSVSYTVTSDFAGSSIKVNGRTALTHNYETTADASIQNLSVEKALAISGQSSIPARGNLSADAHVSGTMQNPDADLGFRLARANVYEEPIDLLQGAVHYSNRSVNIPSIRLDVPAGSIRLNGSFSHPPNDLNTGKLTLKVDSTDIQLAKIEHVQQQKRGIAGALRLAADMSADLREQHGSRSILISNLNADASANALRLNDRALGGANFTARTAGENLNFRFDSEIASSQIHASGSSQLRGDYPVRANLTFANIRYSSLAPFLSAAPEAQPGFDALVEGQATVDGPVLNLDGLTARLQLTRLEAQTLPHASLTGGPARAAVVIHNERPIVVGLNHSVVNIQDLRLSGPGTSVNVSGGMNLKSLSSPLGIKMLANVNLGVLQDLDRDFYSSGTLGLDATLHGSLSQPLMNGRVELKDANIEYSASPNGISNANGVILLQGTSATIQSLTGQSGGGKISLAGFIGFSGSAASYNLRAAARNVRVRYSGVSVSSDADISLTGSTKRSLLAGKVTVERIAYGSSGDVGSILSTASTPPSTPSAPAGFLAGMRLDIRLLTDPDLQVITTYANRLNLEANLTVRGTAVNPGVIGRVTVTDGQLVFFGNTYTVQTGAINFYNPNSIEPVLNISLETIAQNVDVVIGVSGPMNNLKLSYRSDPPLSFEQIAQLLATNTTPADPTIAAHQPTPPQQSFAQMGESAVLSQAVANPLASRVQRVFGITQFKIDPSFAGSGGQPSARVTLQQKIANNVTFTYITDVTQTNSEIIRIEWAFTPNFSAVALRDYNGNASVEFFYKFKKR